MASKAIASLAIRLTASTNQFASKMTGARKTMQQLDKTANTVRKTIAGLGGGFAAFVSARGFANFIGDSLKSIDALKDVANKLDISTEALAGFRRASTLSGGSAETLDKALENMTTNISKANSGSKELKETFEGLGLNVSNLAQQNPADQFKTIADAFQSIANNSDKLATAKEIFGKGGGDILGTLAEGSAGLDQAIKDAIKSGEAVTDAQANQVQEAMDSIDSLKGALKGLGNSIAVSLTDEIIGATKAIENFTSGGIGGAGKVARAFALIELPLLNIAALISGLAGNAPEVKRLQARIKQLADEEANRTALATQIPGRQGAQRIGSPQFPAAHIVAPQSSAATSSLRQAQALGPLAQGNGATPPSWAEQLARSIAPAFVQHMQRVGSFDPRVGAPAFQPAGARVSQDPGMNTARTEAARAERVEKLQQQIAASLARIEANTRRGAPAVAQ